MIESTEHDARGAAVEHRPDRLDTVKRVIVGRPRATGEMD
jgi:hypothetical protein